MILLIKFPSRCDWYQGENNAGNYIKYRTLFPAMISDWRVKWNMGNFASCSFQLANYMEPAETPRAAAGQVYERRRQ